MGIYRQNLELFFTFFLVLFYFAYFFFSNGMYHGKNYNEIIILKKKGTMNPSKMNLNIYSVREF